MTAGVAVGGVLYGLAFPKTNLYWAAWVALIPLFTLCFATPLSLKNILWSSSLIGAIANAIIFYWIFPTCLAAQVNWATSLLAYGLMVLYHALYFSLFCLLLTASVNPVLSPAGWPFRAAALWTTLEFLRAHALSGFPWSILAISQWKNLPAIQIAEWTGPYGVGFLIVLANASLAMFLNKREPGVKKVKHICLPGLVIALALGWGALRLNQLSTASSLKGRPLKVAILQGNIDQYKKWDAAYEQEVCQTYEGLLHQAITFRPDLIVWPETAVPGWYPNEAEYAEWVSRETAEAHTYEIIGAPSGQKEGDFNAAFLVSPQGEILDHYFKRHLVPFGEYVPLRSLLAPWIHVLNEMGNFSSGSKIEPFRISGASLGISICFEAIFPDFIRSLRQAGAQILVNITNDGWFLNTSAPEQHMAANVLRTVENRAMVIRAANTGISCIIEPSGKIQARTTLLTKAVLLGRVTPSSTLTFYCRWGDLFAWLCVFTSLAGFLKLAKS